MNINKNVSIWRGNNPPPSQYHLWQKDDVLLHYNGLEWVENKVPMSSADLDGLMSKEDKDKLDNLDNLIYENLVGKETSTNTVTITRDATKTAIKVDVKVSPLAENSILKNSDGLYHSIDLEYSNGVLSTIVNGQVKKLLTLGLSSIVEDAYYDTQLESLVILFKLLDGSSLRIRIPIGSLIREWEPDNTYPDKVIEIVREEVYGGGADKLSADIRLSQKEHNILRKDGNSLLVDGTSDSITYNDLTLTSVISDILNEIYEKAPIDSPVLTGIPLVEVSPDPNDSSLRIPSTNWVTNKIENILSKLYQDTTWSNLVELRNSSLLTPGYKYRIIDYVTTVANDTEARSAGHQFDLIVTAIDVNKLSDRANAVLHENDIYFAQSNLSAWQVWYCLDNDSKKYHWADEVNGKGVIYRLIDEHRNDCPYDFKNVLFKRYMTSGDFIETQIDDLLGEETLHYIATNNMFEPADVNINVDYSDYKWFYTFSNVSQLFDIEDASIIYLDVILVSEEYQETKCSSNKMSPYYTFDYIDNTDYSIQALNNIVLTAYDKDNVINIFDNRWDSNCCNMSLYEHSHSNTFGNQCFNIFGFKMLQNIFGHDCCNNIFGHNCCNNIFGHNCCNNIFGYLFNYNNIGNKFSNNIIYEDCQYNTFGKNLQYSIIGGNVNLNIIGNDCHNIELTADFNNNIIGNDCSFIQFYPYVENITVGNGVAYLDIKGGIIDYPIQYIHILNGTAGSYNKRLTISPVIDSEICQYVGLNTDGEVEIWAPADRSSVEVYLQEV